MRCFASSTPSPQSSTPQLFETTERPVDARVEQGLDQHHRDAAEPEPANGETGS